MKHYPAPWSKLLVITSVVSSLICVGASVLVWRDGGDVESQHYREWVALLPIVIVLVAALFTVRGYVITADEILIERLGWRTSFERTRLQSATVDREALRGSIRLFGNGGMFSFSGLFRSRRLGRYRAFVTDPARTVILRFPNRVVVVSPSDPDAFVRDVLPGR